MANRWQDKFKTYILHRGSEYYHGDRVARVFYNKNAFHATVKGSRTYVLRIAFDGKKFGRMICSCPHAAKGNKCKHMAAVMYAIENGDFDINDGSILYDDLYSQVLTAMGLDPAADRAPGASAPGGSSPVSQNAQGSERIYPFDPPAKGEYRYFDLSEITKELKITRAEYDSANQLLLRKVVVPSDVDLYYVSDRDLRFRAEAQVHMRGRIHIVYLEINRNGFTDGRCDVPACSRRSGTRWHQYLSYYDHDMCCSHQLALLLYMDWYIRQENPGDESNLTANRLAISMREHRPRRTSGTADVPPSDRKQCIHLHPQLHQKNDTLELSFRIGREKLFVLKNLTELVQLYHSKQQLMLGKTAVLDFAREDFHADSAQYFNLIRSQVQETALIDQRNEMAVKYNYSVPSLQPKKRMPLYGRFLDRFFDAALAAGTPMEYEQTFRLEGKTEKHMLRFREKDLTPSLRLSPLFHQDDLFTGMRLEGQVPPIIHGNEYSYYTENDFMNRMPAEALIPIQPLLDETNHSGRVDLIFGRGMIAELFHAILPQLEPYIELEYEDLDRIRSFIPPEAEFVFYLDAPPGEITCQAQVSYGERTFDLIRWPEGLSADTMRDPSRESDVMEFIRDYFPSIDTEHQLFRSDRDDAQVYRLLDQGLNVFLQEGQVHTTDRFDRLKLRRKMKIQVQVTTESDLLNLSILSEDVSPQELLQVLQSYREKRSWHRLKNGDFVNLNDETLEELSELMDSLHLSPKEFVSGRMHLPMYRALYLDRMLEDAEGLYADRDRRFRQLVKEFKTVSDSDFEPPQSLRPILRSYQEAGYQWLRTIDAYGFGGVLADEMGLGKTLQMIAVLLAAKEERSAAEENFLSLVVCPASLVYNWEAELDRFAPQLSVCVVAGTKAGRRGLLKSADSYDVLITSYDLLKRDIDLYEDIHFDYEIIDEAQFIKNHSTAAAKAVKVIRSSRRFALTGTPIENRLSELWSIFDYLMPSFLYGHDTFVRDFETTIVKQEDPAAAARLKRMVSPFILRRRKSDVLTDLPEKIEEVRYVSFDKKQRQIYDSQVLRIRQLLENQSKEDFDRSRIQILSELTRIRQICCDPSLIFEDYTGGSAKREAILDLIQSAAEAGHKCLVFSQFTSVLALLEADLREIGLSYNLITGQTPKLKRMELVRSFNEDETPVFLISLKAGGTGLNLTGADIVIHYDPWWNLAVQNQATDRAHRIGQEKIVTVYKLISRGTIEEKIMAIQESKKALAEEILSGETASITTMSREELMELL